MTTATSVDAHGLSIPVPQNGELDDLVAAQLSKVCYGYYRDRGEQCYINTDTRVLPYLPDTHQDNGKRICASRS